MAGWNTCVHGFCSDCGFSGFEHDAYCDAEHIEHDAHCAECLGVVPSEERPSLAPVQAPAGKFGKQGRPRGRPRHLTKVARSCRRRAGRASN